ncbi:hypothetical protein QBC45DRAFT_147493 [Copromyces sp. CBS 386.78]|nr:hypothetical protein QBC45DRAFT_147493 [Copromyces sp. CBS 386.78]
MLLLCNLVYFLPSLLNTHAHDVVKKRNGFELGWLLIREPSTTCRWSTNNIRGVKAVRALAYVVVPTRVQLALSYILQVHASIARASKRGCNHSLHTHM